MRLRMNNKSEKTVSTSAREHNVLRLRISNNWKSRFLVDLVKLLQWLGICLNWNGWPWFPIPNICNWLASHEQQPYIRLRTQCLESAPAHATETFKSQWDISDNYRVHARWFQIQIHAKSKHGTPQELTSNPGLHNSTPPQHSATIVFFPNANDKTSVCYELLLEKECLMMYWCVLHETTPPHSIMYR